MNKEYQENYVKIMSDKLVTSEEKRWQLEKELIELQATLDSRELHLADYQFNEYALKRKCDELRSDGEKCKQLKVELRSSHKALKVLRAQLKHVKSDKKELKKRTRQLMISDEKCIKLKASLKESKDALKSQKAQSLAADATCKTLEFELKKYRADGAPQRKRLFFGKMQDITAKTKLKFPELSLKLITLSVSLTILTSLYVIRKAF